MLEVGSSKIGWTRPEGALGHADTRMVSKHYGHLAPSWVADAIRATALGIGSGEEERKVQAIR